MREDGASEVLGSSMILLITAGGISLMLLFGMPLLAAAQGQAQAKTISEDFASASKDLLSASGDVEIPIHVAGVFSLSSLFSPATLGFKGGTDVFVSGGDCPMGLASWADDEFVFDTTCAYTNTNGDCELVSNCLAIDQWDGAKFVPLDYTLIGATATLTDSISGVYRISYIDVNDGTIMARGFFFTQDALMFTSGDAQASLEGGAFQNGGPVSEPRLKTGLQTVIMSGSGVTTAGGTRTLTGSYGASIDDARDARYFETAFSGPNQVGWCISVDLGTPDCGSEFARTSYDAGAGQTFAYRTHLRLMEASLGI